jgi:predicted transcriptional regulator
VSADDEQRNGDRTFPPAVRAALALRAYELRQVQPDRSARSIATELGVSAPTVRRWIDAAEHAERWVVAYDRAQLVGVVHSALAELLEDSIEDARSADDGKERAEHRKVALGTIDRVMRLHGLAAPTRVRFEDDRSEPEPDPELVELIREQRDVAESKRRRSDDPSRDRENPYRSGS